MLVLESIPRCSPKKSPSISPSPPSGIGAGPHCNGQVLVLNDLLGLTEKPPRFAKDFMKALEHIATRCRGYVAREGREFPGPETLLLMPWSTASPNCAQSWRAARNRLRPTMGNLHVGHIASGKLALVERVRGSGHPLVASIFVNPLQFGAGRISSVIAHLQADWNNSKPRATSCPPI